MLNHHLTHVKSTSLVAEIPYFVISTWPFQHVPRLPRLPGGLHSTPWAARQRVRSAAARRRGHCPVGLRPKLAARRLGEREREDIYTYIYIHIHIVSVYVYVYVYVYIYIYVCVYIYICIYMCVCIYIYINVCIYIYVGVYAHLITHMMSGFV